MPQDKKKQPASPAQAVPARGSRRVAGCDDALRAWMFAHAAVWATGQLSPADRILRFGLQRKPGAASDDDDQQLVIQLASRLNGLRWAVIMERGALRRLAVSTPRGTVQVEIVDGGWRWQTPTQDPVVVHAKPRVGPNTAGDTGKKRDPLGLPIVDAKLTGTHLEAEAGVIAAKFKAKGWLVLGAQQLVVAWDGKVARATHLRSPVWGEGVETSAHASLQRARYEVVAKDADVSGILRRVKAASGRWVLQLGEAEVGGEGHVVWIQQSLVAP